MPKYKVGDCLFDNDGSKDIRIIREINSKYYIYSYFNFKTNNYKKEVKGQKCRIEAMENNLEWSKIIIVNYNIFNILYWKNNEK